MPGKDYSFQSWDFGVRAMLNICSIWSFSRLGPSRIISWNGSKVFLQDILLKIYSRWQGLLVELSLTITSIQMIPYEKVIYFKYTKSTFKTADTSWENFEKCIQKILFILYLVAFIFLFFIDRDNDIIFKYSKVSCSVTPSSYSINTKFAQLYTVLKLNLFFYILL